jgi:hypothetical protein
MKNLITALVLAGAAAGAFASEYTNFDIPNGTLTRAEVIAQIGTPNADGAITVGDATQFVRPGADVAHTAVSRLASTPRAQRINTRNASYLSTDLPGRI